MSVIKQFDQKFHGGSTSYMMATILAMLKNIDDKGIADIKDVEDNFYNFYLYRYKNGKKPEKEGTKMYKAGQLTRSINDIIGTPINALRDFIDYDGSNKIKFRENVFAELKKGYNLLELRKVAYKQLYDYYKKIDNNWLKIDDLKELDYGYTVSEEDIASILGQNLVKEISPIEVDELKSVIILCTIDGQEYPNEWLDDKKNYLKYYLDGHEIDDVTEYNEKINSNQAIMKFKDKRYSVLPFVREEKNSLFYFEGEFEIQSIEKDERGHSYFILERNIPLTKYARLSDGNKHSNQTKKEEFNANFLSEVSNHVSSFVHSKGFVFSKEMIKNFLLSLKSKPFVILAGISGTGKSKLVELVANSLGATRENGQFNLIPVRPDWNDSSDLLGYKNLQGEFVEGELTKIIRKAENDLEHPYFVCLDEMNLARVEYYFSDILSVMETRKNQGNKIISSPMPVEGLGEKLIFPENLYIIGTVNMDETTHSFSRKVLDRANTIEFNEVDLNHLPDDIPTEDVLPKKAHNNVFKTRYLTLKDCYQGNEDYIKKQVELLEQINSTLKEAGLHIGYRVRDEYCFYLVNNRYYGLLTENTAVDFQLMQKILPRIQGSSLKVEETLEKIIDLCSSNYPLTKSKAEFMLGRFNEDGFTSFWL
ncbi:McrB family protein [Natranaerobius trueperi]|uniref:ATPase dynein-related AAA domain-containing protein n=1 Tax=Natranaerobius trueperi TaxID=759412 RepID=A0A226C155_9FIRM|nr:AAA family ATPase [Natranaerobius trueperi]OWZ84117.1 hypothetical protein CDO51_05220 [Natranaerobius trueperi]